MGAPWVCGPTPGREIVSASALRSLPPYRGASRPGYGRKRVTSAGSSEVPTWMSRSPLGEESPQDGLASLSRHCWQTSDPAWERRYLEEQIETLLRFVYRTRPSATRPFPVPA